MADATREEVTRVEPLSWWTGMKTPLQLMIQGKGIGRKRVQVAGGEGVAVQAQHKAGNPDFLFVDVAVDADAEPGTYYLLVSDGKQMVKYPYLIREREKDSAARSSFSSEDLVYLVMPDRFARSVDPGWTTYDDGSAVPWTPPELPDTVDRNDPVARHGGNIQGLIDHLDYLDDLGATALWCTPLLLDNQPTESYHGYACGDYYHIDPRFGDNALYRKLVARAHRRRIKVIMDVVTNHCGTAHWWMDHPPFPDWYHVHEPYMPTNVLLSVHMDPYASRADWERQVSGWFVQSMPDMNLENPYVLRYFQQWAVWWIEYAGLDGLRVDTYPYNEAEPMAEWCKAVRREYPDLNIVGECWDTHIPQLAYWQSGSPNRDGFDSHLPSVTDFPLQEAIMRALTEDEVFWDGGMTRIYSVLAQDFAYHDPERLMIFFASHDHDRAGDALRHDPARMKLALALLATLRGIPQLYYGDEMMFCERPGLRHDGSRRIDFPGGWPEDTVDLFTAEGRAAAGYTPDADYTAASGLHDYARALFRWRKHCPAVQHGKTLHFLSRKNDGAYNHTDNTYAYFRYDEKSAVFVYINNTEDVRPLDWSHYEEFVSGPVKGRDVVSGEQVTLCDGLIVEPRSALIVEFNRPNV